MWALGTGLGSSPRAVIALSYWAVSPAHVHDFVLGGILAYVRALGGVDRLPLLSSADRLWAGLLYSVPAQALVPWSCSLCPLRNRSSSLLLISLRYDNTMIPTRD